MTGNCTYFSSASWDDRRWAAAQDWPLNDFVETVSTEEEQANIERAIKSELDDEALTNHDVGDVWPTNHPVAELTREDVLAAWDARAETPDPPEACPHEAHDSDRCVFHGDADSDEVREAFREAVTDEETARRILSGVKLPHLDMQYERIAAPDAYPLRLNYADIESLDLTNATIAQGLNLRYARIREEAVFHNTNFERHVGLHGAVFEGDLVCDEVTVEGTFRAKDANVMGETSMTRATFHRSAHFDGAQFHDETTFASASFTDVSSFDGATFRTVEFEMTSFDSVASFQELSAHTASFSRTEFANQAMFTDATVEDMAAFVEATFEDRVLLTDSTFGVAVFAGASFADRANFEGVTVEEDANFGSATVEEFHAPDIDANALVLTDATVWDGRIGIPDDSEFVCNLTEATLGDVTIEGAPDRFRSVLFRDTKFDGFDFATDAHRTALTAIDWNIHRAAAEVADEELSFETTYLRAKQGAIDQGDASAASEFFIREMRHRRLDHLSTVTGEKVSFPARLKSAFRATSNALLDLTTVYGERPARVVSISLFVIASSTLLYPLTDGITGSDGSTVNYATEGINALPESMYFSIVTFTTVGYGDVSPTGSLARTVASAEAFLGAFLLALLVFVLGRTVRL